MTTSLLTPNNNNTFTAPATINLSASASGGVGGVQKVEFYRGASLVCTANSAPYACSDASVLAGTYSYSAKAYDNGNPQSTANSATATVTVNPQAQPLGVALSSPTNNSSFTAPATINLSANASGGAGGVQKVEFYRGSALVCTATSAPYSCSDTSVPTGNYSYSAKAYDNGNPQGTATTAAASVTVNPQAQTLAVSLSSPSNNASFTAPANVSLSASASGGVAGVQRVEFYRGASLVCSDISAPYSCSDVGVPVGSYSYSARAFDNGNPQASATTANAIVTVTTQAQPLTAALTSPANNSSFTAPATINVSANASGGIGGVQKVEFYRGAVLVCTVTAAPYGCSDANLAVGTYSYSAKAFDNGNPQSTITTPIVNITVAVQPPPIAVNLTSPVNNNSFTTPANINLAANASGGTNGVHRTEFYRGGTLVGTDNSAPFAVVDSNVPAGNYTYTARAFDNATPQSSATSAGVNVSVTVPVSNETVYFHHTNAQGSIVATTNSAGALVHRAEFSPFGTRRNRPNSNGTAAPPVVSLGFTTKWEDNDLRLNYFGGRFYDPMLTRFVSLDPASITAGDIHSFNRYVYGNNNPLGFVDPNGNNALSVLDWYDFGHDVGNLLVIHIVYATASIAGNEAVANEALNDMSGAVADAAISTAGIVNPVPGSKRMYQASKAAEAAVQAEKRVDNVAEGASDAAGACRNGKCSMPGQCFVAGTLVHTSHGLIPIELIQEGDLVVSRDAETGEQALKPVTQLFRNFDREILSVAVTSTLGTPETYQVTPEHPFFVLNQGWVEAKRLNVGDQISDVHGNSQAVAGVQSAALADTFNFEVADFHTYFVGNSGLWVHNSCDFSEPLKPSDLGVIGDLNQLRGTFSMRNGNATMRVDMISGEIANQFQIVANMVSTAKSRGATSLTIEGTLANERLLNILQRRYNLTSNGVRGDSFTIKID